MVAWVDRTDGSRTHSRYFADGIQDLKPPDCLTKAPSDDDEDLPASLEIENTQEREMYDYFLEEVERLEPLVDITQL